MKKLLFILFSFIGLLATAQKSLPKPVPAKLVVDNANVIADYDEQQLEKKLIALDDSTSNQICVVTVPTLNGEVIEEVANKTFREWGIGNKKTNNGILVLVALNDRKIRIEVGYGLEGAIPDVVANDIINNNIKPAFRQGNYYGGINAAIDNLSKAAAGEYKVRRHRKDELSGGSVVQGIIIFVFILVFIIIAIIKGNGGGGSNGGYGRRSNMDLLLPLLFNSGGWGGRSSGGGGWSGGGGFGGFGGGSSGGGGASGSW